MNISLCYRIFKNAQISSQHPYQRGSNPKSPRLSRSGPAHSKCKGLFLRRVQRAAQSWRVCASCGSLYPHRRNPELIKSAIPKRPRQAGLPARSTNPCFDLQEKAVYPKIPFATATVGQGEAGRGRQLPRASLEKLCHHQHSAPTPNDILMNF